MKLRDLFVSIGFDVKDGDLKKLDKGLKRVKTSVLAIGAAAATISGVLFAITKSVASAGDHAIKTAGKLGTTIEELQEMHYAAELAGVGVSNFDSYLQRLLIRTAQAAKGTGEAKDVFKKFHISLKDSSGNIRPAVELIGDLADRFSKISDPAVKALYANKLFGRGSASMVNILNKGRDAFEQNRREARALGFVLSEDTARDAEKFTDEMRRVGLVLTGIKNLIGAQLMPVFTQYLIRFQRFIQENREFIRLKIHHAIQWIVFYAEKAYVAFWKLLHILKEMLPVLRVVFYTMLGIVGFSVLHGIGNMIIGFEKLIKTFRLLGSAGLLANIKIAALPLLIVGLLAAVILIIQDIISYFQGKDSITGKMYEFFQLDLMNKSPLVRGLQWLYRKLGLIGDLMGWILTKFEKLEEERALSYKVEGEDIDFLDLVKTRRFWLGDWVERLPDVMNSFFDKFKFEWPEDLKTNYGEDKKQNGTDYGEEKKQNVSSRFTFDIDKLTAIQSAIAKTPIISGRDQIIQVPMRPSAAAQTVNVNAPINVTIPPGTPPSQVGQNIKEGVRAAMNDIFKNVALDTAPQVNY